ncbi:MAG: nucleotidyl transferase AbiEii/AbiGii toxin family protein [Bacteroidota bacterium]|jgi:predicted nucleotidyltransferase component of viral defense system
MLHLETVEPHTFSLLKQLMREPDLHDLFLVGGTALSLLYGHRKSEDLDLFATERIDNKQVVQKLSEIFKERMSVHTNNPKFGIFCFIDNVKVDIVEHGHPLIAATKAVEGVRMFSVEDIIAMKVQAIFGRAKKKDFWDIAELLEHYTIEDFVSFHQKKYSTQNLLITVPQALTYFAEAEEDEEPLGLKNQTWAGVKKTISQKVSRYLK